MKTLRARVFSEYVVAGSAVFVSFMTLCVYIYQAELTREQQRTSVWPHLQWVYEDGENFRIDVKNKGIGPAIIRKVEMTMDGKPLDDNAAILNAVAGAGAAKIVWDNNDLKEQVMSPGETVTPMRIMDKTYRDFENRFFQHRFTLKIWYSSVYGETWVCSGTKVVPSRAVP